MKYAVTGSTGNFGSLAIDSLMKQGVPAKDIVAVARSAQKAERLKAKGIDVRLADYADRDALKRAFAGVDRLLLVSGSEVGKRVEQHSNAIAAAKDAGVRLVAYTSLIAADTSPNPLAGEHVATEAALKASGLEWIILRNNWYTENYAGALAGAKATGDIGAAVKNGKVGSALRAEYAEAAARALTGSAQAGKTYELAGKPWGFSDLAKVAQELFGRPVAFHTRTEAEQKTALMTIGLPEGLAAFFAAVDVSIEAGSLAHTSGDLEKLLGRKPLGLKEAIVAMNI
jgi:NAD(P)H dehydrogenase (quinone)